MPVSTQQGAPTPTAWITKLSTGETSWIVPFNCTGIYAIHCIGGGQCGFDGTQTADVPGALGGKGADWAAIYYKYIDEFVPNSIINIQVGAGGTSNGQAGTDTWLENTAGTRVVQARGGDSATGANIGDAENAGGISPARTTQGSYILGRGGSGGGGAGGPSGPGANGGDLSAWHYRTLDMTNYHHNGTGGGAANGGSHAGGSWDMTGSVVTATHAYGIADGLQFNFLKIPGDGGDSLDDPDTVVLNPMTGSGNPAPNVGGLIGYNPLINTWYTGAGVGAGGAGAIGGTQTRQTEDANVDETTGSGWSTPPPAGWRQYTGAGGRVAAALSFGGLYSWGASPLHLPNGPGGGGGGGHGFFGGPGQAGALFGGGGGGGGNNTSGVSAGGDGADGVIIVIWESGVYLGAPLVPVTDGYVRTYSNRLLVPKRLR